MIPEEGNEIIELLTSGMASLLASAAPVTVESCREKFSSCDVIDFTGLSNTIMFSQRPQIAPSKEFKSEKSSETLKGQNPTITIDKRCGYHINRFETASQKWYGESRS